MATTSLNLFAQDLRETDPLAGLHGTDARCERYCEGYSDERQLIGTEIGSGQQLSRE
jgi:hypothetical protein